MKALLAAGYLATKYLQSDVYVAVPSENKRPHKMERTTTKPPKGTSLETRHSTVNLKTECRVSCTLFWQRAYDTAAAPSKNLPGTVERVGASPRSRWQLSLSWCRPISKHASLV